MKVAYDARMATWGGIGTYSLELLRALAARRTADDLALLVLRRPEDAFLEKLPELAGVDWQVVRGGPWSARGTLEAGLAARGRADLYHAPHVTIPTGFPGPLIVTVHDLRPLLLPDTMPGAHKRAVFRLAVGRAVRRASVVLADSRHTAATLYRLGFRPRRLEVVPLGVASRFSPQAADAVAQARRRYGLEPEGLLWTGDFRPHKNVETLVRAYALLPPETRARHTLVLAGADGSFRAQGARRLAAELLGPQADRVHFPGHIDSADLPALYTNAALFVFPSTFEGFGLPLLEAASCGTPVVAASAPPLTEVMGDAAVYFPPTDARALAAVLRALLEDPGRRRELALRGQARSRRFRWETTAALTIAAYRGAL